MNKYLKNIDKILLFFLLTPFIVISIFNNPASDDFDFSFKTRDYTFIGAQIYRYLNEGGRYFANGLISLNPLVIKAYWAFKIIPIFVICLFIYSVFYFFNTFFKSFEKRIRTRLAIVFLFVYFGQLVEVSSAFYWLTGAMTYQLPTSLSLLFFGTLARYRRNKNHFTFSLVILLLIMLMGCNEITTLLFLVGTILVGVYLKLSKSKIPLYYYVVLFFVLLTAGFELLAPGNSVRATTIDVANKHQLGTTIMRTSLNSVKFFFKWFPLLFLTSLYIYPKFKNITFLNQKISFLIALGTIFLGMFPSFWTSDSVMPERAQNTIYFYFIFSGVYFGMVIIHNFHEKNDLNNFPQWNKLLLIGVLLFSFANSSIYDVYNDLVTLKAYRYNKEMTLRYEAIENSEKKELVLPALSALARPKTIYSEIIMGLTNSKNNWKNLELKDYYHKEVIIQPTDSIFTE